MSESEAVTDALARLVDADDGDLARVIAQLAAMLCNEAAQTPTFAAKLRAALEVNQTPGADEPAGKEEVDSRKSGSRRTAGESFSRARNRRAPGVLDPFTVYATNGEARLRADLALLDLERLRDIVAEHGMDQDRLAMKWKDPQRVIDRIVDRVAARLAKGDAFRTPTAS